MDFFATPLTVSFMGEKRAGVVGLCDECRIGGTWLDLGAGDGRYIDLLLDGCEKVVALDADQSALSKLWHRATPEKRNHLALVEQNVIDGIPVLDGTFDGVLCVGLLHYFPDERVRQVLDEVYRVLRRSGTLLLEFSTDIVRCPTDDASPPLKRGVDHRFESACELLRGLLDPRYEYSFRSEAIEREPVSLLGREHLWSSRDILVSGTKR